MFNYLRAISIVGLLGMMLGVALMTLRITNTLDFDEALQLVTSGAEWESMFAIWKLINGQQLYTDRLDAPFNAVVYNWLFYNSYGAFTGAALDQLNLGDQWLPTVGRFFTLGAIASAFFAAYAVFSHLFRDTTAWTRLFCIAFAGYVATGPLIGWWAFTIRADVWAFALEIIAIAVFLKNYRSRPIVAVLTFAVLCYAAWSFKQINVYAVGGAGLFLLLRRDWKSLFLLSGAMVLLWAATLALGGDMYRNALLFSGFTIEFTAAKGMFNLTSLALKTSPSLAVIGALAVVLVRSRENRRILVEDDAVVLACGGAFVAALMAVPASFQTGAGDNYYFSLSFFMAFIAVAGTAALARNGSFPALVGRASVLGWSAHSIVLILVLGGYAGVTDVRNQHVDHMARKACLDKLPRPLFADYSYYALPWMTPGNDPFVFSFQYLVERAAGKKFEQDGIGGLIDRGYFKALTFVSMTPPTTFDGASLKRYQPRPDLCDAMTVMLKKPD